MLALAYNGTVTNDAVRKLPHTVVSDTSDDVSRVAVTFSSPLSHVLSGLSASAEIPTYTFEGVLHLSIAYTSTSL